MMRLILPPMMRRFVSLASLAAAAAVTLTAQPRLTIDYAAMARTIVERLFLAPGERVIAVAHPGTFADLIPHLRYEVMKAGGIDLGLGIVDRGAGLLHINEGIGNFAECGLDGLLIVCDGGTLACPRLACARPIFAGVKDR